MQISADVGSLMGSVKSKLSYLWSILPAEYAIPGALLLVGMTVNSFISRLLPLTLPSPPSFSVHNIDKLGLSIRNNIVHLIKSKPEHLTDYLQVHVAL